MDYDGRPSIDRAKAVFGLVVVSCFVLSTSYVWEMAAPYIITIIRPNVDVQHNVSTTGIIEKRAYRSTRLHKGGKQEVEKGKGKKSQLSDSLHLRKGHDLYLFLFFIRFLCLFPSFLWHCIDH